MSVPRRSSKTIFWTEHIKSWQTTGLSQTDYCIKHGLNIKSFGRWKRRVLEPASPAVSTEERSDAILNPFIPVSILPEVDEAMQDTPDDQHRCRAGIVLQVGQYRIDLAIGFHGESLRQLLSLLS